MGRNTWESIPTKYRPLSDRINIVISNQYSSAPDGSVLARSLQDAMKQISDMQDKVESVFIIGGCNVYKEALESANCDLVYYTRINKEFECDTFMPEIDFTVYQPIQMDGIPTDTQVDKTGIEYQYLVYKRTAN